MFTGNIHALEDLSSFRGKHLSRKNEKQMYGTKKHATHTNRHPPAIKLELPEDDNVSLAYFQENTSFF